MKTAVQDYVRLTVECKTLATRVNNARNRLKERPAWEEYCHARELLAARTAVRKEATATVKARAAELFVTVGSPNPAPGVSVARAVDVEFDSRSDVVAWLVEQGTLDLLVPDWEKLKREAIATRNIHCATVVMTPRVTLNEEEILKGEL